ncbi:hypothetical protein EYF80_019256 [Liparis tanakae]|uniref:Uncharacterized protein n=1 Tax=Liparis tanakae TaxID=230148 RepID=A0A4Z2HY73_9TELE|nr:hypothetical protein EYF80_019256 [Liparis tanakae]
MLMRKTMMKKIHMKNLSNTLAIFFHSAPLAHVALCSRKQLAIYSTLRTILVSTPGKPLQNTQGGEFAPLFSGDVVLGFDSGMVWWLGGRRSGAFETLRVLSATVASWFTVRMNMRVEVLVTYVFLGELEHSESQKNGHSQGNLFPRVCRQVETQRSQERDEEAGEEEVEDVEGGAALQEHCVGDVGRSFTLVSIGPEESSSALEDQKSRHKLTVQVRIKPRLPDPQFCEVLIHQIHLDLVFARLKA